MIVLPPRVEKLSVVVVRVEPVSVEFHCPEFQAALRAVREETPSVEAARVLIWAVEATERVAAARVEPVAVEKPSVEAWRVLVWRVDPCAVEKYSVLALMVLVVIVEPVRVENWVTLRETVVAEVVEVVPGCRLLLRPGMEVQVVFMVEVVEVEQLCLIPFPIIRAQVDQVVLV